MLKRVLLFTAVFILGGIAFALIVVISKSDEIVENNEPGVQLQEEIPIHNASFMEVPTMQGTDFTEAAELTVDAVVHIRSQFLRKSNVYNDFFGALREYLGYSNQDAREYPISGWGSGVIISGDGYIVTNNHVVQDAELVEVTLNDKRTFEAEIVGTDPSTDLAVIRINAESLPRIKYGNSDQVKVGEWVLAVGNPFNLTSTVTAGIVSAKARNINILGNQSSIESFIQTDAAVNRGNSGGALVNINGELIGVNAAIASNTGYYTGYSFAIPVNIVKKVVEDIKEYGEVKRAYLGVVIREIDNDFAEEIDLESLKGVYVDEVSEDGGAEQAGIARGDIITHINGIEVNSLSQLLEVLGQQRPGDKVSVKIQRDGRTQYFDIELKNEKGSTNIIKNEEKFYSEELGATMQKITSDDKRRFMVNEGLKVIGVRDNGLLKRGGIRTGFIILSINGDNISDKGDLVEALKNNGTSIRIHGIYPNGMRITYEFGL